MPEILTQEEIDSLLSAVSTGDLVRTSAASRPPHQHRSILPYDFRRPNRITREQVRALQMLHDNFARTLSSSLSAYLRSLVDVQLTSVEQITYGDFMSSVSSPCSLGIFDMAPLKGGAILDVDPRLVFPMIDRILGGPGRESIRIRQLTEIERALVERIFRRFLLDLQQAWLPLGRFEVKLLNLETNPQFVQLTGPHDIAIQVTFEVRVGQVRGIVSLCLPFALLEPILPKLMTQRSFGASGGAEAGGVSADIEGRLRGTPLSLRAVLGEIRLPIGQLTRLAPGEILPLKGGRDLAVTIEVEGKPRFAGRAGRRHGKRAVEITATLDGGGSQHV